MGGVNTYGNRCALSLVVLGALPSDIIHERQRCSSKNNDSTSDEKQFAPILKKDEYINNIYFATIFTRPGFFFFFHFLSYLATDENVQADGCSPDSASTNSMQKS